MSSNELNIWKLYSCKLFWPGRFSVSLLGNTGNEFYFRVYFVTVLISYCMGFFIAAHQSHMGFSTWEQNA